MKTLSLLGALAGLTLLSGTAARADEEGDQLQSLLKNQAPTIVTVKAMLKATVKGGGQSQDQESPMTMQGVVVTPDGLVMVSNLAFSPTRAMELMGRGGGAEAADYKVTPSQIKVIFAGEDKEYDAFLAATDANLDLAFIKVEGLGDRKLAAVDFGSAIPVTVGQKIIGITRLQKGYDYAAYYQSGRITGEINKPRKAMMMEGSLSGLGLPVYSLTGQPVGVLSTVVAGSADEASAAGAGFSMMLRFITGGSGGGGSAFILPGSTVKAVIDQASKRAADLAVERAKHKDDKPAPTVIKPTTPAPPKKPVK
jgi:hypothetical protein